MPDLSFRTELKPESLNSRLSINDSIICLGSCFAESMGQRLAQYKFDVTVNPFGILYNPLSIFSLVHLLVQEDGLAKFELSLVERDGRWYSFLLHSSFSAPSKSDLIANFKTQSAEFKNSLSSSKTIILTLGSAFIYKHIDRQLDVGNCHKVPAKEFEKRLLSPTEISESFTQFYTSITQLVPDIHLVFTLSPVRHLRDGLEQNSVSKAILRERIHHFKHSNSNVSYFPSYEIMMDDLRDYRYYKDDLLHPTLFAEQYIWNKFIETAMDSETQLLMDKWDTIIQAINHKPFNPTSNAHQQFVRKTLERLKQFPSTFDSSKEIAHLEAQLISG